MADIDRAAAEYRAFWEATDVIACPDCGGSGYDPTTEQVDVRACQSCEGSGCIRESDLPRRDH